MKIIYKCRCMEAETSIEVPDRRPRVDVVAWMEMVQSCMAFDHSCLSPMCREGAVEYARIPMDDPERGVGMPPPKPN